MKPLSLLILGLIWSLNSYSQTKIINNKIESVGAINVNKGAKANFSIAKVIVNATLQTKLYFIKSTQQLDSAGSYVTAVYFGNKERVPYFGADITIKFNSPVDAYGSGGFSSAFNETIGLTDPKTFIFKASQVVRDASSQIVAAFSFKSKEKISMEIIGLDGNLPTD